jgi:phosphoglycolate phosphatase-like HAD superfamily hydrolase
MYKLILFDIDGTILRYKKYISRDIFSQVIREFFDIDVPHSLVSDFSGVTDLYIVEEIARSQKLPLEILHNRLEELWSRFLTCFESVSQIENIIVMPGIRELIEILSKENGSQLALLTGNFKENAYLKVRTVGLDGYFPFGAFGSENSERSMLAPLAIQRANEYVGKAVFSEKNSIIIGDAPNDINSAKVNGIKSVGVATGNFSTEQLSECKPDLLYRDFSDFREAAEMIFGLVE